MNNEVTVIISKKDAIIPPYICLINLVGATEDQLFDEAWRCAIDDGFVRDSGDFDRDQFEFKVIVGGNF
jgi:hypothetical protein